MLLSLTSGGRGRKWLLYQNTQLTIAEIVYLLWLFDKKAANELCKTTLPEELCVDHPFESVPWLNITSLVVDRMMRVIHYKWEGHEFQD